MSRDLLWALRLLFVKARAYQTQRRVLDRLSREAYTTSHSLLDVQPRSVPPLDLDTPPFFARHSTRIVDGVRVLGDKTDD